VASEGQGKRIEFAVEPRERLDHGDVQAKAQRVAAVRGGAEAAVVITR
jgi:hypothetical protein